MEEKHLSLVGEFISDREIRKRRKEIIQADLIRLILDHF